MKKNRYATFFSKNKKLLSYCSLAVLAVAGWTGFTVALVLNHKNKSNGEDVTFNDFLSVSPSSISQRQVSGTYNSISVAQAYSAASSNSDFENSFLADVLFNSQQIVDSIFSSHLSSLVGSSELFNPSLVNWDTLNFHNDSLQVDFQFAPDSNTTLKFLSVTASLSATVNYGENNGPMPFTASFHQQITNYTLLGAFELNQYLGIVGPKRNFLCLVPSTPSPAISANHSSGFFNCTSVPGLSFSLGDTMSFNSNCGIFGVSKLSHNTSEAPLFDMDGTYFESYVLRDALIAPISYTTDAYCELLSGGIAVAKPEFTFPSDAFPTSEFNTKFKRWFLQDVAFNDDSYFGVGTRGPILQTTIWHDPTASCNCISSSWRTLNFGNLHFPLWQVARYMYCNTSNGDQPISFFINLLPLFKNTTTININAINLGWTSDEEKDVHTTYIFESNCTDNLTD